MFELPDQGDQREHDLINAVADMFSIDYRPELVY